MAPHISIIIPVYRVERYLEKCIQSIVAAQQRNHSGLLIEVVLIDDGSPDCSGEIADRFAAQYSFIHVIHQMNAGVAAARNAGIAKAEGEWLYFVDPDDWISEEGILNLCRRSVECADADIILFDAWKHDGRKVSPWEHFKREGRIHTRKKLFRLQRRVLYYLASFQGKTVSFAAPWDKLYKRKFVLENRLCFPEELKVLDDMVFNVEAFGAAGQVSYCKDRIYHYRYVPDSITNNYQADRVEKDCMVWEHIRAYMDRQAEEKGWSAAEWEAFGQSFYGRIIKSFSICCRLAFFNRQNPWPLRKKFAYVRQTLAKEPYAAALRGVKLKNLEWKLKIVVFFARYKWVSGIYLLHLLQNHFGEGRRISHFHK